MNIFKKRVITQATDDNYEYWENPCLDDEGTYDYMVESMPKSYCRWEWSWDKWADDNGHKSYLRKVWCSYFRTLDGYDSQSGSDCWCCIFKEKIYSLPYKIKRKIKYWTNIVEYTKLFHKCHNWKASFRFAKQMAQY